MTSLKFNKRALFFYLPGALLLIGYLVLDFSGYMIAGRVRLLTNCLIYFLIYLGSFTWAKSVDQLHGKRIMKVALWVGFILYLSMLLKMTLFDAGYGRSISFFPLSSKEARQEYLLHGVNLLPLRTISIYFSKNMEFKYFLINIVGNLFAFMPFAFFLPVLINKARRSIAFCLLFSGVIWSIEGIQFLLMSGNLDVDDYILNFLGGVLLFFFLKTRKLRWIKEKLTLLEEN